MEGFTSLESYSRGGFGAGLTAEKQEDSISGYGGFLGSRAVADKFACFKHFFEPSDAIVSD